MCSFALASNRYFKQDEETQKEVSYFNVTMRSRLAEVCREFFKEGNGKDGEEKAAEGQAENSDGRTAEEAELKDTTSLIDRLVRGGQPC